MITVVLCTYNRAHMIGPALKSLVEQRTEGCITYELVIVDDGSTDETPHIIEDLIRECVVPARYIRQANSGVAAARNRGVSEARGEWIAFFDDDQIAEPDWLTTLSNAADAVNADCVGGICRLVLPQDQQLGEESTIRRLLGENLQITARGRGLFARLDPRRREAVPGTGSALVKACWFERIGPFSERSYGEDLEFFRRAERAGAKVVVTPNAVVHHIIPAERLRPEYLVELARKGGKSQAEIDLTTAAFVMTLARAALRACHLTVISAPKLLASTLLRTEAAITARKCSLVFSATYIATVARSAVMVKKSPRRISADRSSKAA